MRFAVKEERHLDVATSAQKCLTILEQTSDEDLPSLTKPKLKLIQACAALEERSMIRYHQAKLADAVESSEDVHHAI